MSDERPNPMSVAQRLARKQLPRRFYKQAAAGPHEGGMALLLDGRLARTPGRRPMAVANARVADALVGEWAAQGELLDPLEMPLTRIVNAAIDRVADNMAAVRGDIVAYAMNDLVCYRAAEPDSLVEAQEAVWSPVVSWARERLGVALVLGEGVVPVAQDPALAAAVEIALEPLDALALAAVHTITALTGSAMIALALARAELTAEAAWKAAQVDEDWQMSRWGADETALAAREPRWRELEAAALILGGGE